MTQRIKTAAVIMMLLLVAGCMLIWVGIAKAQSVVPPNRIKPGTINGLYGNIQGQGIVLMQLDPASSITVNTNTIPPTVSVATPANVWVNVNRDVFHLTAPQSSFSFAHTMVHPDSLEVTVGGLAMSPTEDYAMAGNTITLNVPAQAGDVVTLRYQ